MGELRICTTWKETQKTSKPLVAPNSNKQAAQSINTLGNCQSDIRGSTYTSKVRLSLKHLAHDDAMARSLPPKESVHIHTSSGCFSKSSTTGRRAVTLSRRVSQEGPEQ